MGQYSRMPSSLLVSCWAKPLSRSNVAGATFELSRPQWIYVQDERYNTVAATPWMEKLGRSMDARAEMPRSVNLLARMERENIPAGKSCYSLSYHLDGLLFY